MPVCAGWAIYGQRIDGLLVSIYATLWTLKFPTHGDDHTGCGWVEVYAQSVPPHIGDPDAGYTDDPYAEFLPAFVKRPDGDNTPRAVVIVLEGTGKGTPRSHQEYQDPLLVLTGDEYARLPFPVLHERICDALRGGRPRFLGEMTQEDGTVRVAFEDGSHRIVSQDG